MIFNLQNFGNLLKKSYLNVNSIFLSVKNAWYEYQYCKSFPNFFPLNVYFIVPCDFVRRISKVTLYSEIYIENTCLSSFVLMGRGVGGMGALTLFVLTIYRKLN
jgi:hypothetical protein